MELRELDEGDVGIVSEGTCTVMACPVGMLRIRINED